VMQGIIDEGAADLISMSRPFIREPDLAGKLGGEEVVRASCISCNLCSTHGDVPTRCWAK